MDSKMNIERRKIDEEHDEFSQAKSDFCQTLNFVNFNYHDDDIHSSSKGKLSMIMQLSCNVYGHVEVTRMCQRYTSLDSSLNFASRKNLILCGRENWKLFKELYEAVSSNLFFWWVWILSPRAFCVFFLAGKWRKWKGKILQTAESLLLWEDSIKFE